MKIAVVTGASSGFGRAISGALIDMGYRVIGLARRKTVLETLALEWGDAFIPLPVDMCDSKALDQAWHSLPEALQKVDLLVNNAGLALGLSPAYDADFNDWSAMINTNVLALTKITSLILPGMVARNRGHIINMGSIAGSYPYPGGNVYGATKAFVQQFSLNLRADLAGKSIRVTNIEPGLSGGTEFSVVRFKGDTARAAALYDNVNALSADDIANIVCWVATQPEHVNVNRIEVMPVAQTFSPLSVAKNK